MDKNKVFIEKFYEKHWVNFPKVVIPGPETHQQVIFVQKTRETLPSFIKSCSYTVITIKRRSNKSYRKYAVELLLIQHVLCFYEIILFIFLIPVIVRQLNVSKVPIYFI